MAIMIQVSDSIALDPHDIEEQFILADGPGGQNVNKVWPIPQHAKPLTDWDIAG